MVLRWAISLPAILRRAALVPLPPNGADAHQVGIRLLLLLAVTATDVEVVDVDLRVRLFLPRGHEEGAIGLELRVGCLRLLREGSGSEHGALSLVVVLPQELLVLLDRYQFHLLFLLLCELFVEELGGWHARLLEENLGLEPAIGDLQLPLDLLPYEMELVDGLAELTADVQVLLPGELLALILAEIEAIERVLQRERVRDFELGPGNDTPCSYLVRFDFEAAVFIAEQVCLLREYPRQNADYGPAQEAAIGGRIAAVEEGVLLFGVAVDIAVDPNVALFRLREVLKQLLGIVDFWLELRVWVDPLAIEVDASY